MSYTTHVQNSAIVTHSNVAKIIELYKNLKGPLKQQSHHKIAQHIHKAFLSSEPLMSRAVLPHNSQKLFGIILVILAAMAAFADAGLATLGVDDIATGLRTATGLATLSEAAIEDDLIDHLVSIGTTPTLGTTPTIEQFGDKTTNANTNETPKTPNAKILPYDVNTNKSNRNKLNIKKITEGKLAGRMLESLKKRAEETSIRIFGQAVTSEYTTDELHKQQVAKYNGLLETISLTGMSDHLQKIIIGSLTLQTLKVREDFLKQFQCARDIDAIKATVQDEITQIVQNRMINSDVQDATTQVITDAMNTDLRNLDGAGPITGLVELHEQLKLLAISNLQRFAKGVDMHGTPLSALVELYMATQATDIVKEIDMGGKRTKIEDEVKGQSSAITQATANLQDMLGNTIRKAQQLPRDQEDKRVLELLLLERSLLDSRGHVTTTANDYYKRASKIREEINIEGQLLLNAITKHHSDAEGDSIISAILEKHNSVFAKYGQVFAMTTLLTGTFLSAFALLKFPFLAKLLFSPCSTASGCVRRPCCGSAAGVAAAPTSKTIKTTKRSKSKTRKKKVGKDDQSKKRSKTKKKRNPNAKSKSRTRTIEFLTGVEVFRIGKGRKNFVKYGSGYRSITKVKDKYKFGTITHDKSKANDAEKVGSLDSDGKFEKN